MATITQLGLSDQIAVGEQHRIFALIRDDGSGEERHHIGAVEVVGDLAESLSLALSAEIAARFIKAVEGGIFLRLDQGLDLQHKDLRHLSNRQRLLINLILIISQYPAIKLNQ